jgi:HK97 family phage major capsid protein
MERTIVTIAEQLIGLREKRAGNMMDQSKIIARSRGEGKIASDDAARFDELDREYDQLTSQIAAIEDDPASKTVDRDVRMLPGGEFVTGRTAARSDKSLRYHERLADRGERSGQNASFGKWLKGTIMGDWRGADEERAMSIGTPSAGGYLVPTPLSLGIIDLARNQSRVLEAGAQTMVMEHETLRIARQLADPVATWRAESTPIALSDLTFDSITLNARTLAVIVLFSRELFEDAPNLDTVVRTSMTKSLALELDRVALYGTGDGIQPRGLKTTPGVGTLSMGVNGGAFTNYDPFIQAILQVASNNETANAAIMPPRAAASLATLKDSQGRYLSPPTALSDLQMLTTRQLPVNLTQGTATNAADIFLGEWSELLLGLRTQVGIQLLDQRYADVGQIAMLAWLRADVAVAHPGAFTVIQGVTP